MVFCNKCGNKVETNIKYCHKCGNKIESNVKYCNKCGNRVEFNVKYCNKCGINLNKMQEVPPVNRNSNNQLLLIHKKKEKNNVLVGIGVGTGIIVLVLFFMILFGSFRTNYFFSDDGYIDDEPETSVSPNTSNTPKTNGTTAIITDNVYYNVSISGISDANKLISKDSTDQKVNCPKEILKIENDIIKKYEIPAVNLCEMEVNLAKGTERVFNTVYKDYPNARGKITNFTIMNLPLSKNSGTIAQFMPLFIFATSDATTSYPWVIKTQVMLNSSFYLNKSKLEVTMDNASKTGHFPPNTTIYSPIAHELGHYLSFIAILNEYRVDSVLLIDSKNYNVLSKIYNEFINGDFSLKMLQEAYNNYKKDTNTTLEFDEWRGTISKYALSKNNSGVYIYDETIAEAFHDVYLNDNKAKDASKYIVRVLGQHLGNG